LVICDDQSATDSNPVRATLQLLGAALAMRALNG